MKCELLEILPIGWPHKYPTSISVDVFKRVTTYSGALPTRVRIFVEPNASKTTICKKKKKNSWHSLKVTINDGCHRISIIILP